MNSSLQVQGRAILSALEEQPGSAANLMVRTQYTIEAVTKHLEHLENDGLIRWVSSSTYHAPYSNRIYYLTASGAKLFHHE